MSGDLIFSEIDEELRYERLKTLWRSYGLYLVVLAVSLIIGIASYNFWQWRLQMQIEESGVRFEQALDLVRNGENEQSFRILQDLVNSNRVDYPVLSKFVLARIEAKQGNYAAAIKSYDFLAVHAGDETLRMLSLIESVRLSFSEMSRTEILLKFEPISDSSPWRPAARELIGLAAYRDKDFVVAGRFFRHLATNVNASRELRQRAMIMLSVIAPAEVALLAKRVKE